MARTDRTLFLVRGLPGSGKSTLASRLASRPSLAIAADDFFYDEQGRYQFDPKRLGEAHAWCQNSARGGLKFGDVAVANTFTQGWEIAPYVEIAAKAGARLVVVSLFDGGLDDAALAQRNEHGVPAAGIAAMRSRYEHDWSRADMRPPWER
jgi:predicted kinase